MENQKLTQEELDTLQELQEKNRAVVFELGDIQVIRLNLQAREEAAKTFLADLKKREDEFSQALITKYGDGTIDLKSGEFTPTVAK